MISLVFFAATPCVFAALSRGIKSLPVLLGWREPAQLMSCRLPSHEYRRVIPPLRLVGFQTVNWIVFGLNRDGFFQTIVFSL